MPLASQVRAGDFSSSETNLFPTVSCIAKKTLALPTVSYIVNTAFFTAWVCHLTCVGVLPHLCGCGGCATPPVWVWWVCCLTCVGVVGVPPHLCGCATSPVWVCHLTCVGVVGVPPHLCGCVVSPELSPVVCRMQSGSELKAAP